MNLRFSAMTWMRNSGSHTQHQTLSCCFSTERTDILIVRTRWRHTHTCQNIIVFGVRFSVGQLLYFMLALSLLLALGRSIVV